MTQNANSTERAEGLLRAAKTLTQHYLLDEYNEPRLCVSNEHHAAIVALFDAIKDAEKGAAGHAEPFVQAGPAGALRQVESVEEVGAIGAAIGAKVRNLLAAAPEEAPSEAGGFRWRSPGGQWRYSEDYPSHLSSGDVQQLVIWTKRLEYVNGPSVPTDTAIKHAVIGIMGAEKAYLKYPHIDGHVPVGDELYPFAIELVKVLAAAPEVPKP